MVKKMTRTEYESAMEEIDIPILTFKQRWVMRRVFLIGMFWPASALAAIRGQVKP